MESPSPPLPRVGLVGFGEVGKILGAALVKVGVPSVGTWDRLLPSAIEGPAMRAQAARIGVAPQPCLAALLATADLVISAVTASQTLAVAQEAAPLIRSDAWFLDLNSASPTTKREAAAAIDGGGARYVEAAVMTSVPPHGIRVPLLLGGPWAEAALGVLAPLGFAARAASPEYGVASAIKMCRSIMIKGLEALVVESFTSARRYGVEAPMIASLQETFPGIDWEKQAGYFFSRVTAHAKRRAEEMREVAVTVSEIGLAPLMATAIAERQDWVARLKDEARLAGLGEGADWREYADRLLAATPSERSGERP